MVHPIARPASAEGSEGADRVRTHMSGLDERMEGGIPRGFIVLVAGPVGSMKSSLAFSIAHHAAARGDRCLYLSLEQDLESLLGQMRRLGFDRAPGDGLHVVDLATVRKDIAEYKAEWLDSLCGLLERYQREQGCELLVLDSLDALYSLVDLVNPRRELFHFFQRLRALRATVILVSEMAGDDRRFGLHGVEAFLSDGVLHLRMKEVDTAQVTSVRRYIGVVKMRRTRHDTDYHPFLYGKDGFELVLD